MRWFLLIGLVAVAAVYAVLYSPPAIEHPSGVLVFEEPTQIGVKKEDWPFGEYTMRPLARFEMRGRVLSKSRYRFDREAETAPYDLVLGWSYMSDSAVLKHLDIDQAGRWYYIGWTSLPPEASQPYINSANMHMIPSTHAILDTLHEVNVGHVVRLKGYLVQVIAKDDWAWTSSISRYDVGEKSTEIVWLDELEIENGPPENAPDAETEGTYEEPDTESQDAIESYEEAEPES